MDAPNRLGRYNLLKKLASGSALETYLARRAADSEPGGEVVLRKLRSKLVESDEAVGVFRKEFELARGLDHPNLGRAWEWVSTSTGEHALAVEFVWGEDLRRIAERGMTVGRFMPVEIAVLVAVQVAEALGFLHERREPSGRSLDLVHAHVAPSNVLVSFAGDVKLIDFGIAKAEEQLAEAVRARRRQLKYAYMSPEQVEGGRIDHRSDLFSLGTLLYEYTTRKRLFKGSDDVSTMKLVAEADVRAPSESIPSFPPALERVVLKALSKEPGDRYQSALALRDDLKAFLAEASLNVGQSDLADYMTGIFPDRVKEYEKLLGDGYSGPRRELAAELEAEAEAKTDLAVAAHASPPAAPKPPRAAPKTPPPAPPLPKRTKAAAGGKKAAALPDMELPVLPELKRKQPERPEVEDEVDAVDDDFESDGYAAEAEPPPFAAAPIAAEALATTRRSETPLAGEGGLEESTSAGEDEEKDLHPPRPAAFPLPTGVAPLQDSNDRDGPAPVVPIPEYLKRKESDSQVITAVHTLRRDMPDAFEEAAERSRTMIKAVGFASLLAVGFVIWYGTTYSWPWEDIEAATARPAVDPLPPPALPATIPIEVTSEPAGAAISVNGIIAAGRTPTSVPVVPDAPNTLLFYMDGHETYTLDVPIGPTPPSAPLAVALVPLVEPPDWEPPPPDPASDMPPITEWAPPRGRINVRTEPGGATILLDGRDVCRSPCEFEVAANEEQHLTARLPNHMDTVAFTWAYPWEAENDTRFLNMILREPTHGGQRYSYIKLNSTPEGARVRIDGDSYTGRTQANTALRIEALHRIELEAQGYHPWARSFYPSAGRFEVSPVMERIRHEPAQLSLRIDTPGLETTNIYLGPNEIGQGTLEAFEIDGGTYELTLSYTPPPEVDGPRRRSVIEVELPSGEHITEHYGWDGERFALVERTSGPLVQRREE